MDKVKLAIVYYSSTGGNTQMVNWAKEAGEAAGAEVRLLKVPELAPANAIAANPLWQANHDATSAVPVVTPDDVVWDDSILF